MLTSIYYYGYYKPYLISESNSSKSVRRGKPATEIASSSRAKSGDSPYSYLLNKTIKSELVSFATDISSNLNSIKNTAKYIVGRYSKSDILSQDERNNFADGLDDFVAEVNSFENFYSQSTKESSALNGFNSILDDRLGQKKESIAKLGVEVGEDGLLSFDRDKFSSIDDESYIDDIFDCAELFDDIYTDTCEIMQLPLSEHMNFKNLDYYYNYAYAPKDKSTFKFIETGLLVDIKL